MAKPKIYQVDQLQTMVGSMNTAITAAHNQANSAYSQANTGGGPKITSLIYPGNDLAANTVGGQTVYVVGSGFASNAAVYINGNSAPSVSYISAGNLSITTPALSTGTYPVYVINPADGGTAISIPGLVVSGEPSWNTAASLSTNQAADTAWNYTLSANGDAPITYALAAGSSLPSGITLAANGLISGTMSSPPINNTVYTFSVVASDAQSQDSTRQFTVTVTTGEGVLFANNVLLLHADGTNNGNNHAFVDSSSNNYSITRYGNATQGTFSPFSQTGWSAYFDGTGDYLTAPANTALAFSGDFTIEFWVQTSSFDNNSYYRRTICFGQDAADNLQLLFFNGSAATSNLGVYSNSLLISGTIPVADGNWHHIALCRSGSSLRLFVDGMQSGSTATTSQNFSAGSTNGVYIGRYASDGGYLLGYMSNLRILKGTALYTANFTPSTSALTAVANTSLLTLQSNRFIDNSTNAFTITRNGDVSIQAFSPFAPSASYTTANVGGSVYVGGSGNWLSFGAQTAFDCGTSTQFCMETWVYPPTSFPNGIHFWSAHQAAVADGFYFTSSGLAAYSGTPASFTSNKSPTIGAWNHCVVTRDAGGRLRYFLNGELTGTSTSTIQVNTDNRAVGINGGVNFNGDLCYQSQSRYIKGSIPTTYQTSSTTVGAQIFTPPTAALTTTSQGANSSHVIALLNYTNAQIFDQTGKNVLQTVGDAKVSTAQYKYGNASMVFNGSSDYISIPAQQYFNFGAADFTIETWVYINNNNTRKYIFGPGNNTADHYDGIGFEIWDNKLCMWASSNGTGWDMLECDTAGNRGNIAIATSTWTHIAMTRSGNTWRSFVNGTLDRTFTVSGTVFFNSTVPYNIGRTGYQGGNFYYNGYMDDLRITKGYARYTANTSAPSAAFPNK